MIQELDVEELKGIEKPIKMLEESTIRANHDEAVKSLNLGKELYVDLANALPTGVYRLHVFHEVSLVLDNWLSSNQAPYTVEFANDRFFEILHLDREDFEKNPGIVHDLVFVDDKTEFARLNVESNLHVKPFIWEGRFLINDKVIWIGFKSIPRVLENRDIVWTGTLEDITLRKQFDEAISQKNNELQRANADKDFFISILAHDLKSPFNSILGFLELLICNLRSTEIDEIEKRLKLVHYSALNAYNLLDDILVWALSQSGKLPFMPRTFNFRMGCEHVFELLKPSADAKNITLKLVESEATLVYADMNMFNTILRNLISNAIKFSKKGGLISIGLEQIKGAHIVSISDNGIGISSEIVPVLFDHSHMHSTNGTANEKGTGLGLLLCEKFVEKHGGKIWVESELGQGSVFRFTLPFTGSVC